MRSFYLLLLLPVTALAEYEPPPDWPSAIHEPMNFHSVTVDRLEIGAGDDEDVYLWDVQGWWGTDQHKLWIKTEGEGELDVEPEQAELQLLYSHLWMAFWDWQLGLRYDFEPEPERTYLVAGVQGLAPYRFEVDAALFVSEEGDASVRVEAEYDLYLTQHWVLQPRVELNASFSEADELGLGSGVNSSETGLRLRYEVRRELAPYVGVEWSRLYGETRDLARQHDASTSSTVVVAGVRLMFQ